MLCVFFPYGQHHYKPFGREAELPQANSRVISREESRDASQPANRRWINFRRE